MIKRYYLDKIRENLKAGKVLVVYGPRRAGKTTLINEFLKNFKGKVYITSGENVQVQEILESSDFSKIIPFFTEYDLIVIDEAQKIQNIGQGLKIIVDQIQDVKVIATGSSSFDLSNKIGQPLVGRQVVFKLYPVAFLELVDNYGPMYIKENLEKLLIFGSYPEVITSKSFNEKIDFLFGLRDSYLFKDILELENIRNARKILDLLRLVAFQIGKEVSIQELANNLDLSKNTVDRYLDLLEKAFILVNVRGFSRNLRKEIYKKSRYYFLDNGVRNAVIGNFNLLNSRNDVGQLWENFIFIERIKKQTYHKIYANNYFWRTYSGQEIDLVEEREGKLFGFEFKWNVKKVKPPKIWLDTYQNAEFHVISRENYLEFIT